MRKNSLTHGMRLQYASLVLPGMLIFSVGLILPMLLGLRYSLTSWDGFTRTLPWVGLGNYGKALSDPYVRDAWWFTIKFTIGNTIIQNVFAFSFAVALDRGLKAQKLYRTILFVPCLISPVVVGFTWLRMYSDVLPALNTLLGTRINFMLFGRSETVLTGLLIANNWQWIGYWMLIYLAALQTVPTELYEAARVDGASPIRQLRSITVPMLGPAFTICIVGITIGSLKVYDLMVSSTNGGPGRASSSIVYHIYSTAISGRQYGYGSAMSMTLILVLLVVAVVQLRILRRREVQL
ncbi:MAG: sugar ABC transporter permease [Spirochaetia bacterium]|jgi:raffinose/stachyose/melibiose transport system permease protein